MDLLVAQRHVQSYRLISKLGEGAAGTVFLATPTDASRGGGVRQGDLVAVKVYNEHILRQPAQRERIQREARIGATVLNAHLVRVHEVKCDDEPDEVPWIAMEYLDGVTLAEWLNMFSTITTPMIVRILTEVLRGLQALHQANILHRDVKPANVMLTHDFHAKLMDFGVAFARDEGHLTPTVPSGFKFLGTYRYAAPEMLRPNSPPTVQAELYSVGVLLWELMTGDELFGGMSLAELARRKEEWAPVLPEDVLKNRGQGSLAELCARLLDRDQLRRPQSAEEVLSALERDRQTCAAALHLEPLNGYVACALTGLDDEGREGMMFASHAIARACISFDVYPHQPRKKTDPVIHEDIAARLVYDLDRSRAMAADLVIVLANRPSFGVGMELEMTSSSGVPTILVHRRGRPISRMVIGSLANVIGTVQYEGPEELERGIREVLLDKIAEIRALRQAKALRVQLRLGARIRALREARHETRRDVAIAVGVSERLIDTLEDNEPWFHNVGLDVLQRLCRHLEWDVPGLSEIRAEPGGPVVADRETSFAHLHRLARQAGWSFADVKDLELEYASTVAERGGGEIVDEAGWLQRHQQLEQRKLRQGNLFEAS